MPAKFKNNASATIAASITTTDTTIVLTTGFGSYFPTLTSGFYFYATLFNASGESEIVKVTARSSDTLTVVRAQDGTTAKAFTAGDGFALRVVSANLDNFVQIDGAQTITGSKTFSSTIVGSISGNAATVTNGLYTVGDQTVNGVKRFNNSVVVNGSRVPDTYLDVQTAGVNVLTSTFTTGLDDLNFRTGFMNGVTGGTGSSQGKVGLFYLGTGECATIDFIRGGTSTDGSIAFRTSGIQRAIIDNSGNFTATGDITANSDVRLKSDIQTITNALEIVKNLRGTAYVKDGKASIGVIAQEVQEVLPQLVLEGNDGYLSVAYGNMVAVLIEAVKELNAKIESKE